MRVRGNECRRLRVSACALSLIGVELKARALCCGKCDGCEVSVAGLRVRCSECWRLWVSTCAFSLIGVELEARALCCSKCDGCSRTLETILADWEISSNTQVKNRACVPCMAEQTGVHDVIFHANAATCMPGHALELFVPALMLLRACAVHARCAHARRWHRMGDKCTPAAPNQLLTGI